MNINTEIDEYIQRKHYRQINSILLCQDGEIIAQRYYNGFLESSRNVIRSVAKSIMSVGVGIALDKGLIKGLDEPIFKYIQEFGMGLDPLHRAITVRHLLSMTSGIYFNGGVHYHCPMLEQVRCSDNWVSHIADIMVKDIPGTKYCYKEWDVILLAKVLENAAGIDMFDFLNENLYIPLEISSGRWWKSKCGVTYSVADANANESEDESTSNLTAHELLRIGQLFLNNGTYNGNRIISEEYIHEATSPSKCNRGYGFLWWLGDGWYGCRGFGGQNITVIPKQNAVFVMQATPTSRGMGYDDVVCYCIDLL